MGERGAHVRLRMVMDRIVAEHAGRVAHLGDVGVGWLTVSLKVQLHWDARLGAHR